MNEFTPIIQRKAITMDYEEYLKLERRANVVNIIVDDIINAKSLDIIQTKYLKILDEIQNGEI